MIYFCDPETPIYRCDPEKNITCPKTNCGTSCGMTMHKEYSTDGRPLFVCEQVEIQAEIDEKERARQALMNAYKEQEATPDGFVLDEGTGRPILKIHRKIPFTEENVNDVNIALNPANLEIVSHKTHNASGNNREAKTWEEGE